jgi:putative endonuclease
MPPCGTWHNVGTPQTPRKLEHAPPTFGFSYAQFDLESLIYPPAGKSLPRLIDLAGIVETEVVTMGAKDVLGKAGEQAAVGYLESCGFRILDRNWRCADGEIDIVAADQRTFVVCEVKTRSGTRFGTPLDAVGHAKRRRLRRLAAQWLAVHAVRFDQAGGFTIEHVRGVG